MRIAKGPSCSSIARAEPCWPTPACRGDPLFLEALTSSDVHSQLLLDMAAKGDAQLVRQALRSRADPNKRNANEDTALIVATTARASGSLECVRLLLAAGADFTVETSAGTALHMAAEAGEEAKCLELVDSGADPYQLNRQGADAISLLRADHWEQFRALAHYREAHDCRKEQVRRSSQ